MALLPIRLYPDPVLREPAAPVGEVDEAVRKLIADMGETMRAAPGVGLAAPQVGVQRRVLVYSVGVEEPIHALVNPEIVERRGEEIADEGCLSIPELSYPVSRAQHIVVRALDPEGNAVTREAEDFEARIIQHEVDHLDGVLFLDRLAPDDRRDALRTLRDRALDGDLGLRRPRAPSM
ncbi:MAG TPA: peptide deformylase [Actinomycetota bacterium]|jgi:peptide deformylase|nr:peptide deformylase [Actinomycetota bacterium]